MRRILLIKFILVCCVASLMVSCGKGDGDDGGGTPPAPSAPDIEVAAGNDLYGFIGDNKNNPIAGVVVSDGYKCVVTDSKGVYQMKRNFKATHVFYSTPSEYKVVTNNNGNPVFFATINKSASKVREDFKLTPLGKSEDVFKLLCIGDPQVTSTAEITRFTRETMADIKVTMAANQSTPIYGLAMGDNTGDKPDLLSAAKVSLGTGGIPVFPTIGNHDKVGGTASTPRNADYYKSVVGPLDYSFNRGKVHIVCLDNVIYLNKSDYQGGFSNEQVEWLKQDLSYVSSDKMVILFYHIPLRNGTARNMSAVKNLVKDYAEVHLMCGHTHYSENYINDAVYNSIFEHIHGGACGAWWHSTINGDGTPNGYGVYEINGATITNWHYKSSLQDKNYQIRLHRGQDNCTGYVYPYAANVVVANVWNADPKWTVELHENGVKTKDMVLQPQTTDAWSLGYHIGVVGRNPDNYSAPCKHLYTATPNNTNATIKVVAIDSWGNRYEQSTFTPAAVYTEAIPPKY